MNRTYNLCDTREMTKVMLAKSFEVLADNVTRVTERFLELRQLLQPGPDERYRFGLVMDVDSTYLVNQVAEGRRIEAPRQGVIRRCR